MSIKRRRERQPDRIEFAREPRKQANEFSHDVWQMVRAGRILGKILAIEWKTLFDTTYRKLETYATFRFAFEKFGVEAFDDRLIAVDEFHHVSVSDDNRLGEFVRQ